MKHIKLYPIIIFTAVVLVCGCTDLSAYVPVEKYDNKVLELGEANNIIDDKDVEIKGLKKELNILENNLDLSKEETEKYQNLINNLNSLLKNVYYVYQKKSDGSSSWGTGFSIEYKGSYYLLTAGHIVDGEYGKFTNLGFKANFSKEWVYPKLLVYNNDYLNRNDYAIFYSDKVKNGFIVDIEGDEPKYILGNNKSSINIIRSFYDKTFGGESGSPIVDCEGQISGITNTAMHSYFTKIDTVLKAIDSLE